MSKTPAPASTSSSAGWLVGGAVAIVLAVVAWAGSTGRIDLDRDEDQVRATFEVMWGEVRQTGETYPDTGEPVTELVCVDRLLLITMFVDEQAYDADQLVSESQTDCVFRHSREVPRFSRLRMVVQEMTDVPGWKLCLIQVNGSMVLPSGIDTTDHRRPCEVWGLAVDRPS